MIHDTSIENHNNEKITSAQPIAFTATTEACFLLMEALHDLAFTTPHTRHHRPIAHSTDIHNYNPLHFLQKPKSVPPALYVT